MICPSLEFLLILLVDSILFLRASAQNQAPLQILPSPNTYGPDGPWNAVTVQVGNPWQKMDLYPGGTFASVIFTDHLCDGVAEKPCGSGGLFTPEQSTSLDDSSIRQKPGSDGVSAVGALAIDFQNATYIRDDLHLTSNVVISNLSATMLSNISVIYPDGSRYPPQLGSMALGAPTVNQTFSRDPDPAINASLIPGFLSEHKITPSPSYGLHIGSAALNLPLSLWFGGYDAKRISGTVASYSYANNTSNFFNLNLFDIGLSVDNGGSPFSYSKKDGLLASGNSTIINSIPINMNPLAPYLYLPNSTCAAIAQELPVTYNAKFGVYFWNVEDPQYLRIVTSPTYLSFTFDNNFVIKVPFKLLNLALDAPLVSTPTQYFPCQPPQDTASSTYSLGRAFLQAAFIGADWSSNGQWFLAQAPGPGVGTVPQQLPITTPSLPPTPENWANSWKSSWTPLPVTASSPQAPVATTSSVNHLAGGAIAGIVIGALAAMLISLALGFYLYRRRDLHPRHPRDFEERPEKDGMTTEVQEMSSTKILAIPSELAAGHLISELSGRERYEMQQPSGRGITE